MALMDIEQSRFDWGTLDEPTRVFVQDKTLAIHARLKRTAEDIIAIGQDLIEVKERLGHGSFKPWLQAEFHMSYPTAVNFMRVAERFGKNINFIHFPISVLYELAAPSTPDTVIQMVETGQISAALPAIREAKRELEQESITPRQFVDNVFPGFTQWQQDNVALGLDAFADVIEDGDRPGGIPQAFYHPSTDILETIPGTEQESKGHRNDHVMRIMGSSESPEWYTPYEIVEYVLTCFGEIDIDPCSNSHESPAVPARTLYTREDDGLSHEWNGKVYLNPPYGAEIPAWIQKLIREYEDLHHIEEAIILIPARIDTQWFQPLYAYPMCHIRGRLQFENAQYSAPFPSIVVYLGRTPGKFIATFKELGPIMGRIG